MTKNNLTFKAKEIGTAGHITVEHLSRGCKDSTIIKALADAGLSANERSVKMYRSLYETELCYFEDGLAYEFVRKPKVKKEEAKPAPVGMEEYVALIKKQNSMIAEQARYIDQLMSAM